MESPMTRTRSTTFPSSHIRVLLRVRPFLPQEIEKDGSKPISCISLVNQAGEEVNVHLKDQITIRNEWYKLDSFFGQEDPINQIFSEEISAAIPEIFHGRNTTVFAYGATGSGKTYTMQGTENELGLIPLSMAAILSLSKKTQSTVEISYYEVYMDRCYDLLEPKAKEIMPLEDKNGRVQLKGLSLVPVSSMEEYYEAFSIGVQRRKVAHTGLNDVSSRSHAVLVIAVNNGGVKGKLNLIDLAGNEDNRRTGNEGIRVQESGKINQSLFALSNVIYALNNNETRIPFRESKLTRILQDSLGGDSHAFMIACLNPGSYQEAVHTVSLAARSRQIVNHSGSVKRKENPNELVDMEAKLRAWLESKGKIKSIQRMNGLCSPLPRRTPISVSYSKNLGANCSTVKAKNAEGLPVTSKGRKLFDSEANVSSCVEVANGNQKQEDKTNLSGKMNEMAQKLHNSHTKVLSALNPNSNEVSDGNGKVFSELDSKTPFEKLKDLLMEEYMSFLNNANKEELMLLKGIGQKRAESILELRKSSLMPFKSLSDLEKIGLSTKQVQALFKRGRIFMFLIFPHLKLLLQVANGNQKQEDKTNLSGKMYEMAQELHYSHTKVLSAQNPNSNEVSDGNSKVFSELDSKTPFEKLKDLLMEEYMSFLNNANKEELMLLKGIGQKRAESILELRKSSLMPFKSLSDLEKIGLSTKQVQALFKRGRIFM
ncbi:kinesin-like protein KIN-10C [Phalaenopsis equestris]|uniref:kinesin-like protein KIN-10C n=1 Tax=Phalaenopsis equestris TaxID=78828 RepID=UPI0009E33D42|nr:kinesin-like protein KIN-10C [Phalaenopsis equestris]